MNGKKQRTTRQKRRERERNDMTEITMQLDGSVKRGEGPWWREQAHSVDERITRDVDRIQSRKGKRGKKSPHAMKTMGYNE
jgi:hypothetical protein